MAVFYPLIGHRFNPLGNGCGTKFVLIDQITRKEFSEIPKPMYLEYCNVLIWSWCIFYESFLRTNLPSNAHNLLSPYPFQIIPIHVCLLSTSLLKWRWLAEGSYKATPMETKGTDFPSMHGSSIWARFLCLPEMPALLEQSLIEWAIIKLWHTIPTVCELASGIF